MTAMASTTTAAASTTTKKKKNSSSSSFFFLKCGCRDAKAVAVSASHVASPSRSHHSSSLSARPETYSADTITLTATTAITTTTATSTSRDDGDEEGDSPGFSGLLRQLGELERSVAALDCRRRVSSRWPEAGGETGEEEKAHHRGGHVDRCKGKARVSTATGGGRQQWEEQKQRHRQNGRHRRSQSEGGDSGGRIVGKVGESVVVVVKETEDPLGDFRRSMLQMIVEKEIVGGEELRQLLRRFLALNSPSNHPLIMQAFADIWRDVFSGYGDDAHVFLLPPALRQQPHLPRRNSYHGRRHCY